MSDALTDIARDERRDKAIGEFVVELIGHLEKGTDIKRVVCAAKECDSVPRGYFGGQTQIAEGVVALIDKLKANDQKAWAKVLFEFTKPGTSMYRKLKSLSPFDGKLVAVVDYGCGFAHIYGDVQQFFDKVIGETANMKTYDADDYLIVMNEPKVKKKDIVWLRSGICGQKTPRKERE